MNQLDYQIVDNFCSKILEEFNEFSEFGEMLEWLDQQRSIYNQINIQPKGLPAIANCNFEGDRYEYIAKFHTLYSKIDYEHHILDHMPHHIAIMYFFEQMNTNMLVHYLTKEFYMGKDRTDFFYSIGIAFQELQNRGNLELIAQEIYCPEHDKMEYCFTGNNDSSYLHLIFLLDNLKVIELEEVNSLICDWPINPDAEKQVFIDS